MYHPRALLPGSFSCLEFYFVLNAKFIIQIWITFSMEPFFFIIRILYKVYFKKELPLEYYFEATLFNWTCCVVGAWTIGTFPSRSVHWLNLNQAAVARFQNVRHMSSYSTHKATDQKSAHLPDEAIDLFENLLKFFKILLFSCRFCGVLILILYAKW